MESLILFINAFLSYFIMFALIAVLGIAAVLLGIWMRKSKDAKATRVEKQESGC